MKYLLKMGLLGTLTFLGLFVYFYRNTGKFRQSIIAAFVAINIIFSALPPAFSADEYPQDEQHRSGKRERKDGSGKPDNPSGFVSDKKFYHPGFVSDKKFYHPGADPGKKFDVAFHRRLEQYFPDWEGRANFQKYQEKFYKLAIKKKQFFKRIGFLDDKSYYTKEELNAIEYFNGTGFYKKEQNPTTKPNMFDTRQSFLRKMHNPIARDNFLDSFNRRYKRLKLSKISLSLDFVL